MILYATEAVAEAIKSVLGPPSSTDGLIRILRDQAEQIQSGAVTRLMTLIEQNKDIATKLNNATDAVLNGLSSPTLRDKIRLLETEKAAIERDIRALKKEVDASAIPENRLRDLLNTIMNSTDDNLSILLSIVYRVEVAKDTITIWTILDSRPDGTIDHTQDGVIITSGSPFGVPRIPDTFSGIWYFYLCRNGDSKGRHQSTGWCIQVSGGHLDRPWESPWMNDGSRQGCWHSSIFNKTHTCPFRRTCRT